jgi:hypothetical protein
MGKASKNFPQNLHSSLSDFTLLPTLLHVFVLHSLVHFQPTAFPPAFQPFLPLRYAGTACSECAPGFSPTASGTCSANLYALGALNASTPDGTSTGRTDSTGGGGSRGNVGAIVGSVIAALVVLAVAAAVFVVVKRRRRYPKGSALASKGDGELGRALAGGLEVGL